MAWPYSNGIRVCPIHSLCAVVIMHVIINPWHFPPVKKLCWLHEWHHCTESGDIVRNNAVDTYLYFSRHIYYNPSLLSILFYMCNFHSVFYKYWVWVLSMIQEYCTSQKNISRVGNECNIFLVSAIFSCIIWNKTVNIIIIIYNYLLSYLVNITKIKELQFQLFGGLFGIMSVQYFSHPGTWARQYWIHRCIASPNSLI